MSIRATIRRNILRESGDTVTKTFKIEASPNVMEAFEKFMAHLQYCGGAGHSANVAMSIDGDGADRFKIISGSDVRGEQSQEEKFEGYLEMIHTGD